MSRPVRSSSPSEMFAPSRPTPGVVRRRALAIWPRLDAAALRRAGEDVDRVASIIERRSSLPRESIIGILRMPEVTDDEAATWFG